MIRRKVLNLIFVLVLAAPAVFAAAPPLNNDELKIQFAENWKLYFGEPAQAAQAAEPQAAQPNEAIFRELWGQYSVNLEPQDRFAAEAVLRYKILGDKRIYAQALKNCMASRTFSPVRNGELLYYLFLEDEIDEKSVMPLALPPGENGEKFYGAFAQLGEDEPKIRTRLAAYIFRKLIEEKLFKSVKSELPLIWFSTKDLAPSEAIFGRIFLSDGNPFISGEFSEDSGSLKLISILTDLSGKIIKIGIGNPSAGPVLIPADGDILHVMLFNPGSEGSRSGISGTIWKDYSVPVSVDDVSFSGRLLKITVQESGAILGYTLLGADENGSESALSGLPFVRSSGEGVHSYLFTVPPGTKLPGKISLKAHTFSGFAITVPVPAEK